jgi:eukaryotic-like serine/threonine-protein kinase
MQPFPAPPAPVPPRIIGRYALYAEIAAGGMATVHFGRLVGAVGFSRTVAIKRLHPQFAKDPDFVTMFLDEARLAARVVHPNVVTTIDVVPIDDEVFLVMEYVHGEALSKLIRAARRSGGLVPPPIASAIMSGALHGLHAAHEAKSERGEPLNIVHRDVSPQNILVGLDGVARVLDFGVAKAAMRAQSTRDGQMKGKVSYMAPEQLRGKGVDRRTDIFAAGIVLWETLTGRRLFDGDDPGEVLTKLLEARIPSPSEVEPRVPTELDTVVMRALDRDAEARFATARDFAIALEHAGQTALPRHVGEWVESIGGEPMARRAQQVAEIESISSAVTGVDRPQVSWPAQPVAPQPTNWPAVHPQTGEPITSPSQVSHVTVAGVSHSPSASPAPLTNLSATEPRRPSGRRGIYAALIGVAAALGLALFVLVIVLVGKRRNDAAAAAEPPPAGEPVKQTPAEPATAPAVEPTVVAIPQASTSASVDKPPIAKPDEKTSTLVKNPTPVVRKNTPPTAKTSKPAENNCDPPTYVDKAGMRRIKPGCG